MVVQENGKRSIENGQKIFMNLQSAQIVMVCTLAVICCYCFFFFQIFLLALNSWLLLKCIHLKEQNKVSGL